MPQESFQNTPLVNELSDCYDPARHQVLLVSDTNHFKMRELGELVFDTAEALRNKGVTSVGLEVFLAHDQKIFDSFANGEISRKSFLGYLEGTQIPHLSPEDTRALPRGWPT